MSAIWINDDGPEEEPLSRPCERCGYYIGDDWDYAWCRSCAEKKCRHGNLPAECNDCFVESDRNYDEQRER